MQLFTKKQKTYSPLMGSPHATAIPINFLSTTNMKYTPEAFRNKCHQLTIHYVWNGIFTVPCVPRPCTLSRRRPIEGFGRSPLHVVASAAPFHPTVRRPDWQDRIHAELHGTLSGLKDLTLFKPAVAVSAGKDMISHRLPT